MLKATIAMSMAASILPANRRLGCILRDSRYAAYAEKMKPRRMMAILIHQAVESGSRSWVSTGPVPKGNPGD